MSTGEWFESASPSRIAVRAPRVTRNPKTNGRSMRVHTDVDDGLGSTPGFGVRATSAVSVLGALDFLSAAFVARVCDLAAVGASDAAASADEADSAGRSLLMCPL